MADADHDLDQILDEAGRQIQPPPGLQQRVEMEIDRSIRRERAFRAGGAGLLVVVLMAAIWGYAWPAPAPSNSPFGSGGSVALGTEDPGTPPMAPASDFASEPGAIVQMDDPTAFAAPARSSRPNVTIVRVYRDTAAEEPSPESRYPNTPASEASVWTADFGE